MCASPTLRWVGWESEIRFLQRAGRRLRGHGHRSRAGGACVVDQLLFPAPEGGPVRLSLWRRRFWAPAVRAAGVEPLRIHDMRHTAVALWIAAGASPTDIASRAGHTSVAVVLDRYGHLLPGTDDRVNDALDVLANGSARAMDARWNRAGR